MSAEVIMSLIYVAISGITGGTTWVTSRKEFAHYTDTYGKKTMWIVSGLLALVWPISLAVAAVLYRGKAQQKLLKEQESEQA